MTISATRTSTHPLSLLQSVGAVFLGLFAVAALSLGTDQVLHVLAVYPPWGQPMHETGDNLLALAYRIAYAIVGCYLTARLAPHSPMLHALVGGTIGLILSTLGAIAAIQMNLGPSWYPILLALTALPCAWLGGVLHRTWHAAR